ncbi:MAG TPA: hypothetical protein VIL01_08120 [Thermomicrobiales bacterium]|jgi:hypothetical protein
MSQEELLEAYASGRISRRALLRGLAALGVSASAIAAHGTALQDEAVAYQISNFYPQLPRLDCSRLPNIPRVQARCAQINQRLAQREAELRRRFSRLVRPRWQQTRTRPRH